MAKKYRAFTAEFKLAAVRRMEAEGGSVLALARDLGIRRQLLYRWQAVYAAEGPGGLIGKRRGPKPKGAEPPPKAPAAGAAERLRARVRALERLVGRQAMELDFFAAALREVGEPSLRKDGLGGTASTPSSESGHARKAD